MNAKSSLSMQNFLIPILMAIFFFMNVSLFCQGTCIFQASNLRKYLNENPVYIHLENVMIVFRNFCFNYLAFRFKKKTTNLLMNGIHI